MWKMFVDEMSTDMHQTCSHMFGPDPNQTTESMSKVAPCMTNQNRHAMGHDFSIMELFHVLSYYAHVYVSETMAMFGIPQLTQLEPQGSLTDVDQHLACQEGVDSNCNEHQNFKTSIRTDRHGLCLEHQLTRQGCQHKILEMSRMISCGCGTPRTMTAKRCCRLSL